jgi:aspartyl/asparaginyl-tRNA synthetase
MQRIPVSQVRPHAGRTVAIAGFVRAVRIQKRMQFVVVADRSGSVQISHARRGDDDALAATIAALTPGTAVAVTGEVVVDARIRAGGVELRAASIDAGTAAAPLPVDAASSPDLRLDHRWLDLRRPEQLLVFEVQTAAEHAMRRFWIERGFLEIHSPKLMAAASESGAELFRLPYFGGEATLAQSPQFYKQMAIAAGFERVFEIGPVFRANPSFTSRHDTEFTSVDVEVAWIESHEDVMRLEEEWLAFVLGEVAAQFGERVRETFGVEVCVPALPFPRVTLAEAHALLGGVGVREDGDLEPEGERRLCETVRRERGHEFVFVTDYPAALRPFYHMRSEADPACAQGFDLLWNGVEVTSGAQREHRPERLLAHIRERGLDEGPLAGYVDFFRYGCPPHGGFGFGLSRMLMVMLGRPNVREVTFLPRGPNRLRP